MGIMDKAWFGPGKKGLPPRRQETPVAKVDLHKLVADQFVCFKCSRPAPIHVWLNGQLWNEIKPDYSGRSDSGGVLCLYCMSDVLAKMGYKDGTVGLTISNGPFCNMKWHCITQPYEDEIASLRARVEVLGTVLAHVADTLRRQHTASPGHTSNAEKVNAALGEARQALKDTPVE